MYQSLFHKDREGTLDIPSKGGFVVFFLHLKKLLIFKLGDNCFTMLCWFLPYINLRGGFDSKEFVTNCGGGLKKHKKENRVTQRPGNYH